MVTLEVQLEKLELKDGDFVLIRSDDLTVMSDLVDGYFRTEGMPYVTFWFLRPGDSIKALSDEDKAELRRQLDG